MNPNPKAEAWDRVGGMFWTLGRPSAKPSGWAIERLLAGLPAASPVLVVGASTRELVREALERGHPVTVFDFSEQMCRDLRESLRHEGLTVRCRDVAAPAGGGDGGGRFQAALSDRLLNRFTWEEAARALEQMADLVVANGAIRTSVKLGLYPMDERLIACAAAGRVGCPFDQETKTIDFGAAGEILEEALLPHGDIPRAVLLAWYRGRGRERRFWPGDVETLAAGIERIAGVRSVPTPGQPDVLHYEIDVRAPGGGSR